jgi:AAA+ ATPase superfamily predicted ATPase
MNAPALFARQTEIQILDNLLNSAQAELIAIYGRRRIGKTFLIREFFIDKGVYFELAGIHKASLETQLKNFDITCEETFGRLPEREPVSSWFDAFTLLRKQVETISNETKVILFFDELPWLSSSKSEFMPALEHCWNRYLSRMNNVKVIVCGSAASWMIENIINNRGGLHGRLSCTIQLMPFTLQETEKYLRSRYISLSRKSIIELYMVMGGVAKYLTQVEPGFSSAQLINKLCFKKNGYLNLEFDNLYASLFDGCDKHVSIVKALASKKQGLSRNEILSQTELKSGGNTTKVLKELEASGFIARVPLMGKKQSGAFYKLTDEYTLFYLNWILPHVSSNIQNIQDDCWLKLRFGRRWSAWSGYAFEDICLKHIDKIKEILGISGIATITSSWHNEFAQIDGVIDRADNCINLLEFKYYEDEFVIDHAYRKILENKKQQFIKATKTKKAVFLTLVTTYGVKENAHYLECVQNQIVIDGLF